LTRTPSSLFSILALALAYALCVTYNYSYSLLPSIIAPQNEFPQEREHSLPGTKVPRSESSRELVLGSESSQWELSLRGAKISGSEKPLNPLPVANLVFSVVADIVVADMVCGQYRCNSVIVLFNFFVLFLQFPFSLDCLEHWNTRTLYRKASKASCSAIVLASATNLLHSSRSALLKSCATTTLLYFKSAYLSLNSDFEMRFSDV